jgi:hypothetical protein
MFRLLFDLGETLERGRSPDVLARQCREARPLYRQYLVVLEAGAAVGIDTSCRRPKLHESRMRAALRAGAQGRRAENVREILGGESSSARLMIRELLADCRQRVIELYRLTLEKIDEALDAGEIDKVDGGEYIDRPDHQTRLVAVDRVTELLGIVWKYE